jgi:hypothetical protein
MTLVGHVVSNQVLLTTKVPCCDADTCEHGKELLIPHLVEGLLHHKIKLVCSTSNLEDV